MEAPADSRAAIERVARAFSVSVSRIVFAGAAAASLFEFGPRATPIRPTLDVDVVALVESKAQYDVLIMDLRRRGRLRDVPAHESSHTCRYSVDGVTTDIVAASIDVLGFTNPWFESACRHAREVRLAADILIKVIDPVHFVATKLAAFRSPDREGHDDFLASHDIEDVVQVLFGVESLLPELRRGNDAVHEFIRRELRACLVHPHFYYVVESQFAGVVLAGVDVADLLEELRVSVGKTT